MSAERTAAAAAFDVARVRADFPILQRTVGDGRPLVYLDNAASAQKPQAVLDAVTDFYATKSSNVHRGVHTLSALATDAYEGARDRVRDFLNAADRKEIVFTSGTTDAINLVARSFARPRLEAGDEILLTHLEHHSNIVPWQLLREETGCVLRVVPIDDDGQVDPRSFAAALSERTKLAAFAHVSNSLGTILPVAELIAAARARGVPTLLDGAQAVPHGPVDVRALDCDFYAFSGHKLFGPTGIGVLFGKAEHLDAMPPYRGGGDMIRSVRFAESVWNELPYKFEAGTPHVAGAVGLAAAIDYIAVHDPAAVAAHEADLLAHATARLEAIDGVRLIGTAADKAAVVSFTMEGVHPHDIGTILDGEGVAIRTGHHCTQPVMERFGVAATARASFAFYNTREEADALADALGRVREIFR